MPIAPPDGFVLDNAVPPPPDGFELDSPETSTATGSFLSSAARNVLPTGAFMAAAPHGAAVGAGFGAMIPGLDATGIPELVGGGIGALVAGSVAAWGAHKAQSAIADTVAPDSIFGSKTEQQQETEHPIASELGAMATIGKPNPMNIVRAAKTLASDEGRSALTTLVTKGSEALAEKPELLNQVRNVVNVAQGGGINAAFNAYDQIKSGNYSFSDLAKAAAEGTLFNSPWIHAAHPETPLAETQVPPGFVPDAPAPAPDETGTVRTPDGSVDVVPTAINKLRAEGQSAADLPDATTASADQRTATPEQTATAETAQPTAPADGQSEAPATSSNVYDTLPSDEAGTVFTPDGQVDQIQTALNKLRAEGQTGDDLTDATATPEEHAAMEQTPASKADVVDLAAQMKDLQEQLSNPFKAAAPQANDASAEIPSESQPVTETTPAEPSQPDAGTATPPAAVASKISQPEGEAQEKAPAAVVSSAAAPEQAAPTQRDLDEQNALETVQEAVGLNKAQSRRLTELQAKNTPPTAQSEAEKAAPAPIDSEVLPGNAAKSPNAPRKNFFIRPRPDGIHDIIDEVQDQGGIRSPDKTDIGGEYDAHKEAMKGTAAMLRRKNSGLRPDDMVKAVQENFPRIQTPDDLYQAIKSAVKQRQTLKETGGGHDAQSSRFWNAVSQPENAKGVEKINVDQLNVGQTFRIKSPGITHDEMTVTHLDPDTGEVTVKDGPNFGQQDLPEGAEIYIRKGSLVKPQQKVAAVPKLRPGEKGTGSLLQSDEPFNLAGERGTDTERIAAEKSKSDATKKAGAEFQAKNTKDLFAGETSKPSDKANKLADSLESLKTGITKGGQLHAFGLAADLWDRAVSIAQGVIRAGGSVADAIEAAIRHIKGNFKDDFEEQKARFALMEAAQKEEGVKAGEIPPDRERSLAEVRADLADADAKLKDATLRKDNGQTQKEYKQRAAVAAARYRTLRDELLHHPDYIAEQLLKQHQAITEANEILKPHNMAMRPEDYPNPNRLREVLTPEQLARVDELQTQVDASHQELSKMPKKMVSRIYGEMQDDGRLPKSPAMTDLGAGRTLDRMTQFLKENDFDSPKGTFAERLALGKKFADTVAGVKDTVTKAMLKSQAAWKAMVESFKRPPTDDDYRSAKKSWISYDQRTAHENYQYAKALTDKVPLKVRRNAMSVWLDADGDESLLKFQRDSVPDKYREIWDAALKLTPDEKRIALDVKANFAAKLDDAIATGLVEKGREDYGVPQRWKTAPENGASQDPFGEGKKGKPGNPYAKLDPRDPFFSFQRQTPSYFDGIMAKGEPENLDIAHLVTVYDAGFHKALGSRGWIAALQDATATDGLPVVKISGKASIANNSGGKAYFVDSKAHAAGDVTADGRPYRSIDHFALRDWKVAFKDENGNPIIVKGDMLVHPDYFDDVKNELETPKWTTQGIGGAALKVSSFLKSSKFIGPFHIVTEALHASFHGVVPSVHGFDIDLQDPKQSLIARNMQLGFGKAREMFEEGLSSHGGIWAHVPGLGEAVVRMNNFTFNEYIPRLKMKVGLAVLARNEARYAKELTPEQIGELTGRQMDAAFGGQNWRLIGANKSTLAVMRLGLVAPDFLISRAKVIGQAFKPYNSEQRYFLLAQAAGVYTLCRVLNSIFSDDHDPHFEPRNWDSVVIGKRAYHARFIVSDAANLARDLMGLGSFNQHGIPFISGRLGVLPKMGTEVLTGKDLFTGQNKDGLFQTDNPLLKAFSIVAQDTAEWMTPMGVDGFLPGAAAKGQTGLGSALVATVGVSSRKESPANDVWDMARQFNLQSKNPATVAYQKQRDNDTGTPSVYRGLNNLLDAGQLDKAKQEVQALQSQGKTISQIVSHYERNVYFTGSSAREQQFYAGLTPAQQKQYQAAKTEQRERAGALMKALSAK